MVEEKVNESDAVVSAEELKKVEEKIVAKDKAKEDILKEEIEAKVRKELAEKAEAERLVKEKEQLEATILQQAKDKESEAAKKAVEIEELKKQIGSTKSVINTDSPFHEEKKNAPTSKEGGKDFVKSLTPEQLLEVDEESKRKFMEHHQMKQGQF